MGIPPILVLTPIFHANFTVTPVTTNTHTPPAPLRAPVSCDAPPPWQLFLKKCIFIVHLGLGWLNRV